MHRRVEKPSLVEPLPSPGMGQNQRPERICHLVGVTGLEPVASRM